MPDFTAAHLAHLILTTLTLEERARCMRDLKAWRCVSTEEVPDRGDIARPEKVTEKGILVMSEALAAAKEML